MSRYVYNVPGETQTFTIPDDVHFVTIAAAGAGVGTVVESPVIPVTPGDTVEITLGGRAAPGSGTGGINGGGSGHGGSGALDALGYPLTGNPLGTWTTAGNGCTEVRLNGTLILVAGGAGGRSIAVAVGSGDEPSGHPPGSWGQPMTGPGFFNEYLDAEGMDPLVVETLPGASDPNRVPQDTTSESGLTLHTGGTAGGTRNGGHDATATMVQTGGSGDDEWTILHTTYAGAGGGGYGGGAGGSMFEDPSTNKLGRSGKMGTSYAAYPQRSDLANTSPSSTGITWAMGVQQQGTCLITFSDRPTAVLNGPASWDGISDHSTGVWTIPGWITFTIYGSYLDRIDALGELPSYILLSPEDYAAWTAAGSPFPSAEWGSRRPRNPLTQAGSIAGSIEWEVIKVSTGETVYTQTSGLNFNAWKLRWLPDYVTAHDGEPPPSGRYRVRMRLRGAGLPNPLGTVGLGRWSDWVERVFTIGGRGFWSVGKIGNVW